MVNNKVFAQFDFFSGHSVGGKVLWYPDNELAVSTSYKGNLNLGLELFAELSTKGIPVIGDQMRVLEGEYVVPGNSEGGKLTVKHAWRNALMKLENMEAQILIDKNNTELLLEFYLMSTLWHPKIVTVIIFSRNKITNTIKKIVFREVSKISLKIGTISMET